MVLSIDGGSRGNPGPAGYGVSVADAEGHVVDGLSGFLGTTTNNVAEYGGLLAALRYAVEKGLSDITIRSDSQLLVRQMLGQYKVKHPGLQPLYAEAKLLAHKIGRVKYVHVPREQNTKADALANQAMDQGIG